MIKKAVLTVLLGMLIVFGASYAFANQVDGMTSNTGPTLPAGLISSINPGGLGDSLLYGYYNVRSNLNLFNVVNTSTDGVKARVVFRNGKDSRECLDFSICLSKGDVWTAFLVDNGTTAELCSVDSDTLTFPAIPTNCQPFKYDGAGGLSGVTAEDCREGYFEIIGMSGIPGYDKVDRDSTTPVITDAAACGTWASTEDVGNVLMGNNALVNVATLADTYSYNATAVADTALSPVPLPAGSELSIPAAMAVELGAVAACDQADYIFTKSDIVTPYDVIGGIFNTDVVVTFPTRLACHNTDATTDLFEGDTDTKTAGIQYCTHINFTIWDDKENTTQSPENFSPSPTTKPCLPFEVNVIRLGSGATVNSKLVLSQPTGFDLGWTDIDLSLAGVDLTGVTGAHPHATTFGTSTTNGLPAQVYTIQSYGNVAPGYLVPSQYKTLFGILVR